MGAVRSAWWISSRQPALAASYTRAELEEQITSLIDRLIYAALMAPRGGAPK